jgi:hypothetical protein
VQVIHQYISDFAVTLGFIRFIQKNGHETPPEVTDSWKTAIHKQSVTQRKEMLLIQSLLVSLHLLPKRQETLAFVQQRQRLRLAKTTTSFSGVFVDSSCIKRKQFTLLRMAAVIIQYGTRKRQCNDRSVVVKHRHDEQAVCRALAG